MTATTHEPLHRRNDTFLGVFEAIGEDFGFHANWLRVSFALLFFFFPVQAVAGYLALGAVVFLSRKFYPSVTPANPVVERVADNEPAELPLAA